MSDLMTGAVAGAVAAVGANYGILEQAISECKAQKQELEQLYTQVVNEKLSPEVMNGAEVEQYEAIVADIKNKLDIVDANMVGFMKQLAKTTVSHKTNEGQNVKTLVNAYINGVGGNV